MEKRKCADERNDAQFDDAHLVRASGPADGLTYTPTPTDVCPTVKPGAGIDYGEIGRRVREAVATVIAKREPGILT